MDPRQVLSVGDQVLSEHLFAFHSRQSFRGGFQSVYSEVEFDRASNQIYIKPLFPIYRSDQTILPIKAICEAVEEAFKGTSHLAYNSLFLSAQCEQNQAVVKLKSMPVNLPYLFTLPDLSLYESKLLPINEKHLSPTSGPYSLLRIEENAVWLKRNEYYPRDLTANQIDTVVIHPYSSSETTQFIENVDPQSHHLLYLYGHALQESDEEKLKAKGYHLNYFPSEWLIYVDFKGSTNQSDRTIIGNAIDEHRTDLISRTRLGQAAYSIVPSDRDFGLTEDAYGRLVGAIAQENTNISRPLIIGTLKNWHSVPLIKNTIETLKKEFPSLIVKIFDQKEFDRFEAESDIRVTMLGISPADPLNHLTFLHNHDQNVAAILDSRTLTQMALLESMESFVKEVKKIESIITEKRILIPLAHFPGVVAEAPGFTRDESLAWSWGTQAWTYRIRSQN